MAKRYYQQSILQGVSRILAAVLGSYIFATLAAIAVSILLPGSANASVLAAMQLSFLFLVAMVMWVFAARSAKRAWFGVLLCCGLCGCVITVGKLVPW